MCCFGENHEESLLSKYFLVTVCLTFISHNDYYVIWVKCANMELALTLRSGHTATGWFYGFLSLSIRLLLKLEKIKYFPPSGDTRRVFME